MMKFVHAGLVVILATALALPVGCANIANDRTRTQTEGTLAGAGIGALLGAGIGAATGGSRGALAGALIGATVGGVAGLAYGTSVANKKEEYASEEAWLEACLNEAKSVNQQAAAANSRLRTNLASYQAGASSTGYSFAGGESDQKQISQAVRRDLKEGQDLVAGLEYQISSQEQAVASASSSPQTKQQIQREIAAMRKQKQAQEQTNRELASISNRMPV